MKLYLSSMRLGSDPRALQYLVGAEGQAAIITNAWDPYDDRARYLEREVDDLASVGFQGSELDLRDFVGQPDRLRERLERVQLLWVVGGNSFVLARAMNNASFKEVATDLIAQDQLVYAGYSAGSCVTGPDLSGCQLMDDPDDLPDGYRIEDATVPLRWVPWRIVPHFRSDHPEAAAAECAVDYLRSVGLAFRALRDGQAIVVEGAGSRIVGAAGDAPQGSGHADLRPTTT